MKRTGKVNLLTLLITFLFAMLNAAPALGQLAITSHTVAGGGCGPDGGGGCGPSIGGGNFSLEGTVGQHDAADLLRQPPFSLRAGFWYTTLGNTPTAANGTVSGRIVDENGQPVEGVVLRLSGTQSRLAITDAKGNYSFDSVETNGFYTVTPSRANFTFSPSQRSFSQLGNHTDAAFTGAAGADTSNPVDTAEYFVRQQYLDFLGREPDNGGFNYWSNEINLCNGDTACIQSRRIGVSAAFFVEQEFQQTGAFVYDVYKGALGRKPLFSEYSYDRRQLVGGPNLEAAKAAFTDGFVQRPEFVQKYQAHTTAEPFVDALIQNVLQSAGVDLNGARANLISSYHSGTTAVQSRSLVLRAIAEDQAFMQAEYNAAFVLMEYFGYLRRDPEPEGYIFWLNVLNNREPGNFRGMVCSFITSTEYQRRFSSVVTHSNAECRR